MTYVIDKLEQKGLLNRNNCPNYCRAIHVTLTTDGMDLMNKSCQNIRSLLILCLDH